MNLYYNITGNTIQSLELKEVYNNSEDPTYVCFTNIHDTDAVSIDLYITRQNDLVSFGLGQDENGDDIIDETESGVQNYYRNDITPRQNTNDYTELSASTYSEGVTSIVETYYYMKNLVIPKGVTLKYDYSDLKFNRDRYILKIKLNNSDSAIDVIIK
jgi:hypothetical protein